MTKQAALKRRVRARMAKTGESYAAARRQVIGEWDLDGAPHVTNGDCTDIPGIGLAERVIYWRDILHEGAGAGGAAQRAARAGRADHADLDRRAPRHRTLRRGSASCVPTSCASIRVPRRPLA